MPLSQCGLCLSHEYGLGVSPPSGILQGFPSTEHTPKPKVGLRRKDPATRERGHKRQTHLDSGNLDFGADSGIEAAGSGVLERLPLNPASIATEPPRHQAHPATDLPFAENRDYMLVRGARRQP